MSTYVFTLAIKLQYSIDVKTIETGDVMQEEYLEATIVGKVLAEFRKKKGISQEVLSGLADIGRTHLSAIERGERKPTMETFYRLCLAMDTKMSDVTAEIERRLEERENVDL